MENRQQEILDEIRSMILSLRNQVEELEKKLDELRPVTLPEPEAVQDEVDADVSEDVMEMEVSLDIMDMEIAPEPAETPEPEDLSEPVILSEAKNLSEDLPSDEPSAPVAVIDAMAAKQAWRTDMPGTPVRDIRSAISLNDRILFINYLFNEDPMSFQETLTALNSMTSFDDAVNLVVARHPEWDLESDTVYRFMMALRRRLQ